MFFLKRKEIFISTFLKILRMTLESFLIQYGIIRISNISHEIKQKLCDSNTYVRTREINNGRADVSPKNVRNRWDG